MLWAAALIALLGLAALAAAIGYGPILLSKRGLALQNPLGPQPRPVEPGNPDASPGPAPSPGPPSSTGNPNNPSAPLQPDRSEEQWAAITVPRLESACLSIARQEAKAAGYDERLVFSCSCAGDEGAQRKTYACTISALDGGHPASMDCVKSERGCRITSEKGEFFYTFDQMESMG